MVLALLCIHTICTCHKAGVLTERDFLKRSTCQTDATEVKIIGYVSCKNAGSYNSYNTNQ